MNKFKKKLINWLGGFTELPPVLTPRQRSAGELFEQHRLRNGGYQGLCVGGCLDGKVNIRPNTEFRAHQMPKIEAFSADVLNSSDKAADIVEPDTYIFEPFVVDNELFGFWRCSDISPCMLMAALCNTYQMALGGELKDLMEIHFNPEGSGKLKFKLFKKAF